ncbi:hypothetical protein Tco_0029705, partial [Tanacetum coccineum]
KNDEMINTQLQIPDPAQGEQQLNNDEMTSVQKKQPYGQESTMSEQTPPDTEQAPPESTALVVHASVEKDLEEKVFEEEPPSKRLKFLIPNPITTLQNPLNTILPQNISLEQFTDSLLQITSSKYSITPHRDENKGKGIATEEEPVKLLMHLIEQGGSYPKMLNLQQFNISGKKMTLEDAQAHLAKMKRLVDLKTQAAHEAKRKRMLEEYNHYITYRADNLPIYEKFVLEKLGFSEWIEVHTLASKNKSKANDILLKNLKAKFEWIKTQAAKLGIPPPPQLTTFGLFAAEKKRKRSLEIIKEVSVNKYIILDGMHRNLILPPGVEGSIGLVIKEPESGIFFYNGNFDLLF